MRISDWSSDVCSSDLINGNLLTSDRDGPLGNGFLGSVFRGRSAGKITYGADGSKTFEFAVPDGTNSLGAAGHLFGLDEIGRAHVCTPVTNAHLVCRLLLENKPTTH